MSKYSLKESKGNAPLLKAYLVTYKIIHVPEEKHSSLQVPPHEKTNQGY